MSDSSSSSRRDRGRRLIIGNWKMNGLRADSVARVRALLARFADDPPRAEVAVCPPATLLGEIAALARGTILGLGAQDCHYAAHGAHTGDISPAMLVDLGCRYVILGHSERRAGHGETDALVRRKAAAALEHGLVPIVCVGESAEDRARGAHLDVIFRQFDASLPDPAPEGRMPDLVVAYEPVWAIGSGRTPSPGEIVEAHGRLRERCEARFGRGGGIRLLYGGSVGAANAAEILALDGVDGALVGGASLDAASFSKIVISCP